MRGVSFASTKFALFGKHGTFLWFVTATGNLEGGHHEARGAVPFDYIIQKENGHERCMEECYHSCRWFVIPSTLPVVFAVYVCMLDSLQVMILYSQCWSWWCIHAHTVAPHLAEKPTCIIIISLLYAMFWRFYFVEGVGCNLIIDWPYPLSHMTTRIWATCQLWTTRKYTCQLR